MAATPAVLQGPEEDVSDEEEIGEQYLVGEQYQLPLPSQATRAALMVPPSSTNELPPAAPAAPGEGLPCADEVPAAQDDPATFGGARCGIRDPIPEEPPAAQVAPAAHSYGGCLTAYIHLIMM